MQIGHTTIYVKDVLETVEFYTKAFNMKIKFIYEGNDYAEMEIDSSVIAFCSETFVQNVHKIDFRINRSNQNPSGFEIAFIHQDVQKVFDQAIKAGGEAISPPTFKPWGQTVGYLKDINGILIEICNPME